MTRTRLRDLLFLSVCPIWVLPRRPFRGQMISVRNRAHDRNLHVPGGSALFHRMFTRLGCDGRPPRFRVEFYPYASLVLTMRCREEMVYVRFSDLLRHAPLSVLEAAAALLLARVYRRKAPAPLVE